MSANAKEFTMSQLFSLVAQKAGFQAHASADADGLGIIVNTDAGPTRVGSVDAAIRIARDHIGRFLEPASRGGVPWGLLVTVVEGCAAYGEWPLAGGAPSPSFKETALARIRHRWHDHGPTSALENAIEIIGAYNTGGTRARRAA
jgi:hypothetical protein